MKPIFKILLAAVAIAAVCSTGSACSVEDITVTKAAAAFKPSDSSAYSQSDVTAHFKQMGPVNFISNTNNTFTCVDARGDGAHLSTPGGDYAELAEATYMFFEQNRIQPNASSVGYIFKRFMDKVASPSRPFYFHTDESKLSELFKGVAADGVKPKPVVFPAVQPTDPKEVQAWYKNIAKPEYQGCGHVRLMLYKYKEYGLTSPFVAEELLRQYFAYWWPTPEGSPQREKIMFNIKRGPLSGKAVAIVTNEGPACKDKTPASIAAYRGSSLFVYHQAAVAEFRAKVLAPFFADMAAQSKYWGRRIAFDMPSYIKRTDKLAATQLQYTVENLAPVDSVSLYKVAFTTSAAAPAAAAGKTRGAGRSGIIDEAGKSAAATKPKAAAVQPKL